MSGLLVWLLVALGLGVVVVRRRTLAVGLVTAQALVLAVAALRATGGSEVVAAAALAVRAFALAALLLLVVSRTRESRRVRAGISASAWVLQTTCPTCGSSPRQFRFRTTRPS